jgi:hypothetical protein
MVRDRCGTVAVRALVPVVTLVLATFAVACAPGEPAGTDDDANGVTGEFVTYVADHKDGTSEWWHALRTKDGREIRLDFETPPLAATGNRVRIRGAMVADVVGERMQVSSLDVVPKDLTAELTGPALNAAPATDSYALVLVDLGSGVNLTAAQGMAYLNSLTPSDKSFAEYYSEVSYGKYQVTGDVIGPYPFTMTTCDTTGMYQAIEPMITGTYNHLIYYFNETSLCTFGGLGEEGSVTKPAKRTWMNGSLSCVVLMQEPGHNLGLMHANTIKCGTNSFSTDPATDCTITEYGSSMTTMGGGCRQFNAYERWYMQWLSGCNGVRVPATGTFNLLPLETNCVGGSGVQVLQVPFPATLPVSDPQATSTTVNLNDYYVELRTAGGIFDTFSTTGGRGGGFGGGSTTFTAPTVFIYASDNVRVPPAMPTGRGGGGAQNSVWTELINTTPSGTPFTGLTAAGQSFADPAGGATITLQSISATGASVTVSYPDGGTGSPTCIDGTTLTAPGPASCAGSAPGTGGTSATGGSTGTSATGGAPGTGGAPISGTGGATTAPGVGGAPGSSPAEATSLTGGCACSFGSAPPESRLPNVALGCLLLAALARRRRCRTRTGR